MKRLIILLCGVITLSSCREIDKEKSVLLHSFIPIYTDALDYVVAKVTSEGDQCAYMLVDVGSRLNQDKNRVRFISAPEVAREGDTTIDEFLKIAERNGDRSYDRVMEFYLGRMCHIDNFRSIEVVCMNADWDSSHPAKSSLNDLCKINFRSCANYVRSGYTLDISKSDGFKTITKRINDLAESDLSMISSRSDMYIYFDNHPATGKYDMQITLTTTEGKERKLTCTFNFDQKPGV